jgi:hypothetical protein
MICLTLPLRQQEVKQHKEEWAVVMVKLEQVAGLVDIVGTLCGRYNLEEKDLPPGLREIFQSLKMYPFHLSRILNCGSLYFSELDGIKAALKQSKEIGSIKRILLRKDLQQKVKQHDGNLSNVVQRFQVCHRFTNPNHSSSSLPTGHTSFGHAFCATR